MAKLIALWGKENSGKTKTLTLLINKLQNLFGATTIKNGKCSNSLDEWVILQYHNKRIGIITAGDDETMLKKCFDFIDNYGTCDIYVCASRVKRGKKSSVSYLETRFGNNDIMWQEKWRISYSGISNPSVTTLQNRANDTQALDLVLAIEAL